MQKWYTFVSRSAIERNKARGTKEPTLVVRHGPRGQFERVWRVRFPAGAEMVTSFPDPVTVCGAHVVVQSDEKPEILDDK